MPPDVEKAREQDEVRWRLIRELLKQFREENAKGSCIPVNLRAEGE